MAHMHAHHCPNHSEELREGERTLTRQWLCLGPGCEESARMTGISLHTMQVRGIWAKTWGTRVKNNINAVRGPRFGFSSAMPVILGACGSNIF